MWPYNTLGLMPDASAADIRRAYARLLKTTRPDEDAQAFQRLREARDAALDAAERRKIHARADDLGVPEQATDAVAGPAMVDRPVDSSTQIHETVPPFTDRSPRADDLVESPLDVDAAADGDGDVDDDIEPISTFTDACRLTDKVLADSDAPVDPESVTLLMRLVPRLDLREMGWLEDIVLSILAERAEDPVAWTRLRQRDGVLTLLDELAIAFGWDQNDRRLHEVLSMPIADLLMDDLKIIRRGRTIDPGSLPMKGQVPLVDQREFALLFGDEETAFPDYYVRCRAHGHWVRSANWWLAPCPVIWLVQRKLWRELAIWIGLAAPLGLMLALLDGPDVPVIGPAHSGAIVAFGTLGRVDSGVVALLAAMALLAFHIYVAEQSSKLVAKAAIWRIMKADRQRLFDPVARRAALYGSAALPPWGRLICRWVIHLVVGAIFIAGIAAGIAAPIVIAAGYFLNRYRLRKMKGENT